MNDLQKNNLCWALLASHMIQDLLTERAVLLAADSKTDVSELEYQIGTYLNEIKDIMGRIWFHEMLKLVENFGLSDYMRQKLMRGAK